METKEDRTGHKTTTFCEQQTFSIYPLLEIYLVIFTANTSVQGHILNDKVGHDTVRTITMVIKSTFPHLLSTSQKLKMCATGCSCLGTKNWGGDNFSCLFIKNTTM